ncbi:MAG: hypothetical protein HY965_05160 [Ignavibacteriales bacterium]|nr:hypothetical protein [Ignavibacteriales bacterium]
MTRLLFFCFICSITFSSCFVFDFENDGTNRNVRTAGPRRLDLKPIIKNAEYDISSRQLFKNPEKYRGKVLCLSVTIIKQEYLLDKDTFLEVSGNSGESSINMIMELDHPHTKQANIGEDITTITVGKQVRVLVRFNEFKELQSDYGTKKTFPMGTCIAIFRHNDPAMLTPVWLCEKF